MSMAFPERPLRGRVELPVQWIVNGDGTVSFQPFISLFLSVSALDSFSQSSYTNCFHHYSILHTAPRALCFFLLGCLPYLHMGFHTRSPVTKVLVPPGEASHMHHVGLGNWQALFPSSTAECRRILPCESNSLSNQHPGNYPAKSGVYILHRARLLTFFLFPSYTSQLDTEPQTLRRQTYIHTLSPFIFQTLLYTSSTKKVIITPCYHSVISQLPHLIFITQYPLLHSYPSYIYSTRLHHGAGPSLDV